MGKLKTKIKYKINLGLNYFRYLSNKSIIIIKHKIHKAHNTHVDNLVGYFSIAFVATLVILFNMNEYMRYIDIKYSLGASIDSSYSYEESENIPLNTAEEIDNLVKEALITDEGTKVEEAKKNEVENGKMTTWGGEVDKFNKIEERIRSIFSIIPKINYENTQIKQITQTINENNLLNTQKTETNSGIDIENIKELIKENQQNNVRENNSDINIITEDTNSQTIKIEPIIVKDEPAKTETKIQETIKIEIQEQVVVKNTSNDNLANSINKEINNELDKLNGGIFNGFKIKILKNNNLVLENGIWYTYSYSKYHGFGKGIIPSESDLSDGGLNKDTHILLLGDNNGAMFVTDYKKIKLISDNIISDISNKQAFLNELAEEKKYLPEDTDNLFNQLKNETNNITNGVNNTEKIQKIYDYILKNISYSKVFNVNNKYIFSGIHTYNNHDGICTGYARLYLYMLSFAGVDNVKLIKGNIVEATDFPNIGHAWIQIGSNFYDPTFDDPIGNIGAKSYDEYKYFGLPRDLFYTNRFNYGELPNNLKVADLETRKNYVISELSKLQSKYSDYNLIKSITN